MHGDDIASEAYAVFRGRKVHEIGVISARAHRGRGLAVHACRRLIEECEADGMGTYWSCNQDNPASNRVAGKLGFTDRRAYRFFVY
jgi:RimJ/RimL family protein N-acetyltransferase